MTRSSEDLHDGGGPLQQFVAASVALSRESDEASVHRLAARLAVELCEVRSSVVVARAADLASWEVAGTAGADDTDLADEALALAASWPGASATAPSADLLASSITTSTDVLALLVVAAPGADRTSGCRQLLDGLAVQAGVALERIRFQDAARRELELRQIALEERDEVARLLQRSLLPPTLPPVVGIDVAASYLPMTHGIGGDFYDLFPMRDDTWGVVLGDVCGKGPGAASVTALCRHVVHTASMAHREPGAALVVLNQLLVEQRRDERSVLCTALFGHLRVRPEIARLTVAIAGHPSPIVLRNDGSVETWDPTGPILGLFSPVTVGDREIELAPGDVCVLYTDGATDVQGADGIFGEERLLDVIAGMRGMHAEAVVKSIERAVVDFQEGEIRDDLAILALTVPPFR